MIQALFLFNFSSGKLLFLPTLKTFQINAAGVQSRPIQNQVLKKKAWDKLSAIHYSINDT